MSIEKEAYPFNSQLLNNNDTSPLIMLCNLRQIHRDLGARDADTNAIQNASSNELSKVLARDLNRGADEPPETRKEDRVATAPFVRDRSRDEGADDKARSQRGSDGTLDDAVRVIEVV